MSRIFTASAAVILATAAFVLPASSPTFGQMSPGGISPGMTPGGHRPPAAGVAMPAMPGQDAFGTVQEIVRILEADPKTDWSKVNLAALREHLIDMNDVTLNARAVATPLPTGLEIAITGDGRTLAAIQRMIPAQAREINGSKRWVANAEPLPDGVLLKVTASDAKETAHIRGLGFIGLLVSGSHHQEHHLAMAKGELPH
jgi:hypothetical protein